MNFPFVSKKLNDTTWLIDGDGCTSYVVIGENHAIMIDNGYGDEDIRAYAEELTGVKIEWTANTHGHFDHAGGNRLFDKVYMSRTAENEAKTPYPSFNGRNFEFSYPIEYVTDGSVIDLGNHSLEVFDVPAHSLGDIMLLDRNERILYTGDNCFYHAMLVYQQKEPQPTVEQYAHHLEKVMSFRKEFDYILSGHGTELLPAGIFDSCLANAQHILDGYEGKPMALSRPKPQVKGPDGRFPKGPRPGDLNIYELEYKRESEFAGVSIGYDNRYIYNKKMTEVTAFSRADGSGQKITEVVVRYNGRLKKESVKPETFVVMNRTITGCYLSEEDIPGKPSGSGCYVVLELSNLDESAVMTVHVGAGPHGRMYIKDTQVSVCQVKNILMENGEICLADSRMLTSSKIVMPYADQFQSYLYQDQESGHALAYNLYLPNAYVPEKSYPLVLFIHDAGVCSDQIQAPLVQGLGALAWTTGRTEDCIVLAPQYTRAIVDDDFNCTWEVETTARLVQHVIRNYSVDEKRIYGTGQSMGCMTLAELNAVHPGMFTACLLVAGQWDPERMKQAAKQKLWIVVSQGDKKAFPGMNACVKAMEDAGAKIVRSTLDARDSMNILNDRVREIAEKSGNIYYSYFVDDSLIPDGEANTPGNHHTSTWKKVYTIQNLLNWLLQQS